MLLLLASGGGGGGGGGPAPLTYGSYVWDSNYWNSTLTFAGLDIGAAASDRWVIAAILTNHNTSRSVVSVTIGGVSATRLYEAPSLSADGITMSWWKANVPTGTTATVVANYAPDVIWDGACATYYCTGEPIFHAGAHDATYTGVTFEVALDVPEGGAVLALVRNDGAGVHSSWAGVAADQTDNTNRVYVASADELSAESGRTVSWTGTATSSVARFFGLAAISVEVPPLPGGGGILDSEAVAVGSGLGSAASAAIRAAVAATIGAGQVAAPAVAIRPSEATVMAGGGVEASAALVRSSVAEAIAGGIAAAGQSMIRSSPATAAGGGEVAAASAAIRSSIAVALGGALVEGHLTSLAFLVSVAVAIGGSHGQAPAGAILGAPAASIGAGAAQGLPAVVRGSHASVVGLAASRAAASIILGSEGPAVGASVLTAAAVLIRSAPAVALSLAGAEAAPMMIRSGLASASALAILAGLGVLVPEVDYSNWRLAFASEASRTGTILNKARRTGKVLNPTRRGRIVELKE